MTIVQPTKETLEQIFKDKASGYHDQVVKPDYLFAVGDKFDLNHPDNAYSKPILFSDSALGQILNRVQIPVAFYKRCSTELKEKNFEHFNSLYDKDFLFRFNEAEGKGHIRAVLSDQYSVIDDTELFSILSETVKDRSDISYRILQYDNRITQLLIDFNDCVGEYNGKRYTAGLSITNSETGHSSVWIEPLVHIPGCTFYNRRVLRSQGVDSRIVHRGKLVPGRIHAMVEEAKKIAQIGVIQLAEAFQSSITRDHALRSVASINALPSRFQAILEEEWSGQDNIIKAEAARRIILFAQELPLFQRIQVEQEAGRLTGIFTGYKSRFQDLVSEITDE